MSFMSPLSVETMRYWKHKLRADFERRCKKLGQLNGAALGGTQLVEFYQLRLPNEVSLADACFYLVLSSSLFSDEPAAMHDTRCNSSGGKSRKKEIFV